MTHAGMGLILLLSGLIAMACLAFAVAASRLNSARAAVRGLESKAAAMDRELSAVRRQAAQAEADQLFLARFVRELPHVAHELHAQAGGRQIPRLILGAALRVLEPRKAIVAVRRRPAESDPDRHTRLTVAAVHPDGCLELGAEIPIGKGEIGYAAEALRVMDRRDFENEPPPTRKRLREETAPEFKPDIVAPMVFGEEVVGVIAVEGLKRGTTEAKDVLRLLAQVGAVSVHTQAKYTEMKATASIDGLTGIFNKRYLTHRLAEEMRRAQDEVSSVSVFIFDLDNFKHYNDRNGHVAGDRLLQRLARLVQENVRKDTIVGRYGGEEFLVIFPGAKRAQALAAAENVRAGHRRARLPLRLRPAARLLEHQRRRRGVPDRRQRRGDPGARRGRRALPGQARGAEPGAGARARVPGRRGAAAADVPSRSRTGPGSARPSTSRRRWGQRATRSPSSWSRRRRPGARGSPPTSRRRRAR